MNGMLYEVALAMNSHHHAQPQVVRRGRVLVTTGKAPMPHGLANGQPNRRISRLVHRIDRVRVAWVDGCMVSIGATWRCGEWSNSVLFTDTEPPNAIICVACAGFGLSAEACEAVER